MVGKKFFGVLRSPDCWAMYQQDQDLSKLPKYLKTHEIWCI